MGVLMLTVILCCVVLAWLKMRPRHFTPHVVPGALPFIGHGLQVLGDRKYLSKFQEDFQKYSLSKGGVIEYWVSNHSFYVVTDPEDCQKVVNSCLGKPYPYSFGKDFLNNGLVTTETSKWKIHRKLLNPAFSQQVINSFVYEMSMQSRNLASQLASKAGKGPFDARKYLIIYKRKSELKAKKDSIVYDDTPGKFKPILDRMLQMAEEQDAFTDDEIRHHLNTFVAAAYDTTAASMVFALLEIGSNPEIQERIFKEIKEVLLHEDDDLTKEDLNKLMFLEAVIKETLRLYPAVPIVGRKLDTDLKLKNCTLRAGNTCGIGLYGLLRHPMWGPDAEQFRPERWLDPANLPQHPSLYASFGIGKRNCIGKVFSMMVLKTALAHILRRYHVTGDINNVVCEFDVVLKPVEGHLIGLTLRT